MCCSAAAATHLSLLALQVSFFEHKGDMSSKTSLPWIADSNEKFCKRHGYSLEEFEGWREQWLQSERVKEYGLDKPREAAGFMRQAARQRGSKARVAARRQQVLGGAG